MRFQKLVEGLMTRLEELKSELPNPTQWAFQSVLMCRKKLLILRNEIIQNGFVDQAEEILFFKEIKQVPLTHLIYYKEIYTFEIKLPKTTLEIQKKFIQKQLRLYNEFFLSHIDFGQYIEMGCTHLDSFYFVRSADKEYPIDTSGIYPLDSEFNTPKDTLLAQFKAYGMMVRYLKKRLSNLYKNNNHNFKETKFNLRCTASKTDLIELTYALISSNAVQGDIKELIKAFEFIFNIEFNDFYRTFTAIRNRTNNPTKFLDRLKVSLLNRMEEVDN